MRNGQCVPAKGVLELNQYAATLWATMSTGTPAGLRARQDGEHYTKCRDRFHQPLSPAAANVVAGLHPIQVEHQARKHHPCRSIGEAHRYARGQPTPSAPICRLGRSPSRLHESVYLPP